MNTTNQLHKNNYSLSSNFLAISVFLISLFFIRCANMQTPTGGPKDSIPPTLLKESIPNLTRNFDKKQIVLEFDEYIKLNNYQKEFSISPDVEKQPDYKVKKKSLVITLPDSLEKNTTYTINFGEGLVDFNEGNPIKNYTYVFATGPELDSLTLSGSITNAYTKTFDPKQDLSTRVLLIPTRQDSIFGKKKANIFTTVDSTGNFMFKNLKEDTYRIYALKEENNDRIYNHPNELIGYYEGDTIYLNTNRSNINIEYSKGKPNKFKITNRKIDKDGRIFIEFNHALDNPSIEIIDPKELNEEAFKKYTSNGDSAIVFLEKLDFDSLKIAVLDKGKGLDTTTLRRSKNDKYNRELKPILNIQGKVDRVNHITITSDFQIADIDKEKVLLKEDTTFRKNFQLQKDSLLENTYHLRYNWKAKKSYELTIEENAIKSLYSDSNKEYKTTFAYDDSENFGDITFTINGLEENVNYIVEVIDEAKTKVFDKKIIKNTNQIKYSKFPGGKYSLRIIKDLNANNRWDGIDIYQRISAEPIWYLNKTFTIRANWEQSETIAPKF